jgi:hypothetical protein
VGQQSFWRARLLAHNADGYSGGPIAYIGSTDDFRKLLHERVGAEAAMSAQTEPLVGAARHGRHPWREIRHRACDPRLLVDTGLRKLAEAWNLVSPSEFASLYRQVSTDTMCSVARLRGLYRALGYVVKQDIGGDVVECGCARGGSAALMALTLRQLGSPRKLWLFDTFEGLPAPSTEDPDFEIANLFTGTCVGTLGEVRELFDRLNATGDVRFVKGLFQETLPATPLSRIAVLHIDGDWYESVKVCLHSLYDKVVPGGVIQFDDYGYWQGARKAVDEFLEIRGIQSRLQTLDYSGRFLIKAESRGPLEIEPLKSSPPQQRDEVKLRAEKPISGLRIETESGHKLFGLKSDLPPGAVPLLTAPVVIG